MKGAIFGIAIVAGFLVMISLTACQSDADYNADRDRIAANAKAVDLDPDRAMDAVCITKLQHPEKVTTAWRKYCEGRGFRTA